MSIQKGRATKKNQTNKSDGQVRGGNSGSTKSLSYVSSRTGIARADQMSIAIDEIYRNAASGAAVSVSQQAHVMLNAVGKMLALENLKFRVGQYADKHGNQGRSFFLGANHDLAD